MDRLDAMEMAVAAIDEGSLAAAARRFGRSAAAATRAIALLEDQAGEILLLRSTRGLRLTDAGERHAAVWRDVLARLSDLRVHQAAANEISGTLVVTAPELFGRLKVSPVLEEFLAMHGKLQSRAFWLNRMVDMRGEGVDVAIRLAHLQDSSLVAVKLGTVKQIICAAPDYLVRHGVPPDPAALSGHACIGTHAEGNHELWTFRREANGTRIRSVQVETRLSLTSAGAGLDAAIRGHGLVCCRSYQVADQLTTGQLRRVLTSFEPEAIPVNIIFRPNPRRRSPVRGFVDHAIPILRRELAQIAAVIESLPKTGIFNEALAAPHPLR